MTDRDKSVEQWLRQTPVAGAGGRLSRCRYARRLVRGLLDGRARSTAEAHAASCARCQAMLAIMVRTTPAPAVATGSPFRKWLMMLSPAMAAAAAVALWVAVGQRPAAPVIDELTKRAAKSERAAEVTQPAPAPAVGAEKEVDRKAPADSLDRDAPKVTADARRESGSRTRTGAPADAVATAPLNERMEKKRCRVRQSRRKSRDAEPVPRLGPLRRRASTSTNTRTAGRSSVPGGRRHSSAASPAVTVPPPGPAPLQ